jgi:hypothetical protein
MWGRIPDALPIEIRLQRKHDAMGKRIETFRRDEAGLLDSLGPQKVHKPVKFMGQLISPP